MRGGRAGLRGRSVKQNREERRGEERREEGKGGKVAGK